MHSTCSAATCFTRAHVPVPQSACYSICSTQVYACNCKYAYTFGHAQMTAKHIHARKASVSDLHYVECGSADFHWRSISQAVASIVNHYTHLAMPFSALLLNQPSSLLKAVHEAKAQYDKLGSSSSSSSRCAAAVSPSTAAAAAAAALQLHQRGSAVSRHAVQSSLTQGSCACCCTGILRQVAPCSSAQVHIALTLAHAAAAPAQHAQLCAWPLTML